MSDIQSSSSQPMQATVADESEELKAELDGNDSAQINGDGDVEMKRTIHGDGEDKQLPDGDAKPEAEVKAEPEDPNKLPDDACETLYVQNLNEKVLIPGPSLLHLRFAILTAVSSPGANIDIFIQNLPPSSAHHSTSQRPNARTGVHHLSGCGYCQ